MNKVLLDRYTALLWSIRLAWRSCIRGRRPGWSDYLKAIYLTVDFPIELIGDIVCALIGTRTSRKGAPKKIVIIKTDQLGDVLFSTLLIEPLKKTYPEATIDYVVQKKAADILVRQPLRRIWHWDDPSFTALGRSSWSLRTALKNIREHAHILKELRNEHFDLVINARVTAPSSHLIWRYLGGTLIGWSGLDHGYLLDRPAACVFENQVRAYANLLRAAGVSISSEALRPTYPNITPHTSARPLAILGPVTYDKDRSWGNAHWHTLVAWLQQQGMDIGINALSSQRNDVLHIKETAPHPDRVHILEEMPIDDFAHTLAGARFFAGIDSFPAHLALALNVPGICLTNTQLYFVEGHSTYESVLTTCLMPSTSKLPILPLNTTGEEAILYAKQVLNIR